MRSIIVLAALVAAAAAGLLHERALLHKWTAFKAEHGKTYSSPEEEAVRMQIYEENAIKVDEHNARYAKGEETFKVALNHLSDMLTHEVVDEMAGLHLGKLQSRDFNITTVEGEDWKSIDWRKRGAVSPVKNQGHCGSCYIFGSIASLESQMYIKTGKMVSLSEQNVLDCQTGHSSNGCHGGDIRDVYRYIIKNGGIDTEASYRYHAKQGTCHYDPRNSAAKVKTFRKVPSNEHSLDAAVASVGPITTVVEATWGFQHYHSGIIYDRSCTGATNHAVVVVGYDSNGSGRDYWIGKNSWGKGWGEKGFFRLARNKNNHCGVANLPIYPVV